VHVHTPSSVQKTLGEKRSLIFAHWHGHELAILHMVKPYRLATMTSTSKDGQLIDYVVRKLGGATSKGSSTRGGSKALRGLVRLMKEGRSASMAVDGPKGPVHVVKPGVFSLSLLTQSPIYPVGVAVDRFHCFEKSWNKAILPKPFSTVSIFVGEGSTVREKPTAPQAEELARQLAHQLNDASVFAARRIDPDSTEVE
jgi:lysophospholipid acyltransferase (LPLAT)-like uncharacterized protein